MTPLEELQTRISLEALTRTTLRQLAMQHRAESTYPIKSSIDYLAHRLIERKCHDNALKQEFGVLYQEAKREQQGK